MIKDNIDLNPEPNPLKRKDFKHKILSLEEIEALQALTKFPKGRLKKTLCVEEELLVIREHCEQP